MTENKLRREMGFVAALTTVIGTVIGGGVFFKATAVYGATGTASLGLLAWIIGGFITICAGLSGAELAAAIPKTGGMIAYLKHTYGDMTAYLLGWAQTIIYFPANIAALSIIFGTQAVSIFGVNANSNKFTVTLIAVVTATFITFMNFLGAKTAGSIQSLFTFCKLIPLAILIIFGLLHEGDVSFQLFPIEVGSDRSFLPALGSALLATMFAYDGWILVGNIAGEMKNPKNDLPKAIVFGLAAVMAVYLLVNIAFLFVLTAEQLAGTSTPATEVSKVLFGNFGGKLVLIGILISVFGTINGYTMTGMRVPYVMAREQKLPFSGWFAKLSKTGVPYNAGLFILIVAIFMMFIGGFDLLTDMLVFVIWIFYTLTFIAVYILRKREPDLKRPYKVPFLPIVLSIAIIGGIFIVVNTLITQTILAFWGIGLTLIGLPVYYILRSKHIAIDDD
ncbi:amino acid permease [Bacillus sp. AFS041924]|nr:amino acid permease [Bacillus sp. AFS041924]PGS49939.1 amino acid permease [Bacillus sp. AFS041924]